MTNPWRDWALAIEQPRYVAEHRARVIWVQGTNSISLAQLRALLGAVGAYGIGAADSEVCP